ncbi:MAG: hypothetical protein E6J34_20790 [Chloroflexi bacterium]|nr:MAG: hypothetical protein E6J34_20790 [Chloroflexota bacterium]
MLTIEVSAKLIMHSDYEQRRSGLIHFCGVLGYNATTETWREPSDYTPMLAGMQFCMRLIMLEYTLSQGERNEFAQNYSETPEELFKAMHAKWLVVGTGTTFNYVHSLLQYGKRVTKDGRDRERVR